MNEKRFMKTYRLKQWYPGLPEEWKEFEGSLEVHNNFNNGDEFIVGRNPPACIPRKVFQYDEVVNNPEFWEEVYKINRVKTASMLSQLLDEEIIFKDTDGQPGYEINGEYMSVGWLNSRRDDVFEIVDYIRGECQDFEEIRSDEEKRMIDIAIQAGNQFDLAIGYNGTNNGDHVFDVEGFGMPFMVQDDLTTIEKAIRLAKDIANCIHKEELEETEITEAWEEVREGTVTISINEDELRQEIGNVIEKIRNEKLVNEDNLRFVARVVTDVSGVKCTFKKVDDGWAFFGRDGMDKWQIAAANPPVAIAVRLYHSIIEKRRSTIYIDDSKYEVEEGDSFQTSGVVISKEPIETPSNHLADLSYEIRHKHYELVEKCITDALGKDPTPSDLERVTLVTGTGTLNETIKLDGEVIGEIDYVIRGDEISVHLVRPANA